MSSRLEELKTSLLDKVVKRVEQRITPPRNESIRRFIELYYQRTGPEDLVDRSALDLYGAALAHWNLAHRRAPGERLIRVYNPRVEESGWQSTHTIIEIVQDDMPFLVDSVRLELNRHGLTVHLIVHPVLDVARDDDGQITRVVDAHHEQADMARFGRCPEAFIHLEVDRQADPATLASLRNDLDTVLGHVEAAVTDWPAMVRQLQEIIETLEQQPLPLPERYQPEAVAFLRWLEREHFTFLGFREQRLGRDSDSEPALEPARDGLGILRGQESDASRAFSCALLQRHSADNPEPLVLTKSNARATVHRAGYMDCVSIKRFDPEGNLVGEWRFLGRYTSAAYNTRPKDIPLLRCKVGAVLDRSQLRRNGHLAKALISILETLPRDELFQSSEDELFRTATGILHLQERQQVRLFIRRDPFHRFFSCLVYLPRERFSTEVRIKVQALLRRAFDADSIDFTVSLSESLLARIYLVAQTPPDATPDYDVRELEAQLVETIRSWDDDLHDSLVHELGEARGTPLFTRYRSAFPASYREEYPAAAAVFDIQRMETLEGQQPGLLLYRPLEVPDGMIRMKLFRRHQPVALSTLMPILENMGVQVIDERPHQIKPAKREPVWIHDIGMAYRGLNGPLEVADIRHTFQQAFFRVWNGDAENDGFNRLVLDARLDWRRVAVLRAYCKYLQQTGFPFSQPYVEQVLASHPQIASLLADLFVARFDPGVPDRQRRIDTLGEAIAQSLTAVESLDEDRILRRYFQLMQATLRTNFFQDEKGEPKGHLAFKLASAQIPDLPDPRPACEIFVYAPHTEGIHLRGGKVARGGIRWSDRKEDYRTEVFGLMKAQMVKNAVIVPVGAKGGFVVKGPETDRGAVERSYVTFIRGLLDLTDNLAPAGVQSPPGVVRHDDDDPYLVVAADKGTASFSDLANAVAAEYGFWLGDAFASGGSTGYDHKKMGITARGAWESVKRHFRELGRDIQSSDVTVVGIGGMNGDVFGNGMLLSRHIRLVGAFTHDEIFLDPNPDPEIAWAERKRLFENTEFWAAYDPACLSPGGGVYSRRAKRIELSPEVREALAIDAIALSPDEVIQALLRAPVDLLWNGGIGTFVKAARESDESVGDRANDAIRVDAETLRCKVIGEGGNLGLTDEARITFTQQGGRINTDYIDNSGGVDCSDHEVNIKILLDEAVQAGEFPAEERNPLLAAMTDEVAALVLRNNYQQTECLSVSEQMASAQIEEQARFLRQLERRGLLDRHNWHLPDEEVIAQRQARRQGLTRPELAVLLAFGKIDLFDELVASDLADDPCLNNVLLEYFPSALQERLAERISRHRLRRELIATVTANSMINRMGITFPFRMQEHTGAPLAEIARAYTVACRVFRLPELSRRVTALDNRMLTTIQLELLQSIRRLISRATLWLLRNLEAPIDVAAAIGAYAAKAQRLADGLDQLLLDEAKAQTLHAAERLTRAGVPAGTAADFARLPYQFAALDIADVSTRTRRPDDQVAAVYFSLGARLDLEWLYTVISALPVDDHWVRLARAAIRDDLYRLHRSLTLECLEWGSDMETRTLPEQWMSANAGRLARYHERMAAYREAPRIDLALLSVALNELRQLIKSGVEIAPKLS